MSFESVLRAVVEALQSENVPFMITGSLASSYHGAPRATQDIDFVIDAPLNRLLRVASALREIGFYASDTAIREAVETRGMFNVVDPESGWKAGLILRKDRPFSRTEFEARQRVEFAGIELNVVRPEDVIVAKLEWSRLGRSDQQLRDVAGILEVQGHNLDRNRVERWVEELGLAEEWRRAQQTQG